MYFILHEMTQIRAGVAAAIFLLALEDIKNRNFKIYLIKTILAMMFHYSAIIMIFVYLFNPNKMNVRFFFFIPIIGIIIAAFKEVSLNIFSKLTILLLALKSTYIFSCLVKISLQI